MKYNIPTSSPNPQAWKTYGFLADSSSGTESYIYKKIKNKNKNKVQIDVEPITARLPISCYRLFIHNNLNLRNATEVEKDNSLKSVA